MCYESSSAPYSHVTNGSRDYGEVHDDWSSSRRTITYRVARDKSRSAKRQRVSVSWFCEWPWSPRELCDNLVRKKPNASVLIESSLQKLTASGFSKSARQGNKKTKQKWKPLLKFYSSQRVSSHIRTASPVSTQFCGYGKQTKKPRLFRL